MLVFHRENIALFDTPDNFYYAWGRNQKICSMEKSDFSKKIVLLLTGVQITQDSKKSFEIEFHKDETILQKLFDILNKNSFMPIVEYLQSTIIEKESFKKWLNSNYSFTLDPVEGKRSMYQILFDLYFHDESKLQKVPHQCVEVIDAGFEDMDSFEKELAEQNEIWGAIFVLEYKKFKENSETFRITPRANFTQPLTES